MCPVDPAFSLLFDVSAVRGCFFLLRLKRQRKKMQQLHATAPTHTIAATSSPNISGEALVVPEVSPVDSLLVGAVTAKATVAADCPGFVDCE